jgi:uncharacterized protein (DUF1499 family)
MLKRLMIITVLGFCSVACSSNNPIAAQGAMVPCPDSPNCVSSRDKGDASIEPFVLKVDPQTAWPDIIKILNNTPRTEIIEQSPSYIHATATSLIFRFVDDLELELSSDGKTVDVRSASRTGHSDMGVNRERVEKLRIVLRKQNLIL